MNSIDRLRVAMSDANLDALLVSDPTSVGWLTGFTGTFGQVLVTPDKVRFITDSRYDIQAREEIKDIDVFTFASPVSGDDFLADHIKAMGIQRLGFESASTTYNQWSRWNDKGVVELVAAPDLFGALRMVKTADEIERIRKACQLADAAFTHIQRMIQPGVTEIDIALDLEFFMRRQGAGVAFPSIVVSGERSARPHGKPSEKKLEDGDFLTMDFGAKLNGYNSDITRTVVVGKATDRHREVYGMVLEAQMASLNAIRPGAKAADVDRLSREVLATKDLAKYFGHGLGHGLGTVVHDSGRMSASSTDVFEPGQIWTVEPGVYIPGFGGVRIEDDVVVVEDGIEILTHSTKELLEFPG